MHRFRICNNDQLSSTPVEMPAYQNTDKALEELPFVLGLSSVISKDATTILVNLTIAFKFRGQYKRFRPTHNEDHLRLPFTC